MVKFGDEQVAELKELIRAEDLGHRGMLLEGSVRPEEELAILLRMICWSRQSRWPAAAPLSVYRFLRRVFRRTSGVERLPGAPV